MNEIVKFANDNQMKINSSKSKVKVFNRSRKYDFMPEVEFSSVQKVEVVEECKLLGITITSDLKWHAQINDISKRQT